MPATAWRDYGHGRQEPSHFLFMTASDWRPEGRQAELTNQSEGDRAS